MIEHNDFNNELLSQCGDENSYTQDDSFLDSVNLIIEELEAKEQNEQPLKKKVKKVEEKVSVKNSKISEKILAKGKMAREEKKAEEEKAAEKNKKTDSLVDNRVV